MSGVQTLQVELDRLVKAAAHAHVVLLETDDVVARALAANELNAALAPFRTTRQAASETLAATVRAIEDTT